MESRDELLFIEATLDRVEHLVRRSVWEGVDLARCRNWYSQLAQRDCQLLGACLLDNLVYRSKTQLLALLEAVMTNPGLVPPSHDDDMSVVRALQSAKDPGIRLTPVIRLDQPPTKSGMYVLRLLARSLGVRDKWMIWPQALSQQPEFHTLILVDDFCGSGDQLLDFVNAPALTQFLVDRPNCRVIYLTAASHENGILKIRMSQSRITVLSAETLTDEHHFFDGKVLDQYGIAGLSEQLQKQYAEICDVYKLGGQIGPLGYQAQALTYAFAHGTPNNSLPILWSEANGWTPLLER